MTKTKLIRAGYKKDMWFIVERIVYKASTTAQTEHIKERILKIFYSYDKAQIAFTQHKPSLYMK